MLTAQRRRFLLDRLAADGRIVARDVALELQVSEDTVRRDLRELAADGLCQRVYGGALPVSPATASLVTRATVSVEGKARVAAAAVGLLRRGGVVLLDGGTTAVRVARALPRDLDLTVVTPSPVVAVELLDAPRADVWLLGGRLSRHSGVTSGAAAAAAAGAVHADVFLLGVTGVHHEAGLTTGDGEDAAMKRAMAARAAETWVLASAEKIGAASPFAVLGWPEVSGIVTDAPPDHPEIRRLTAAGVAVVHA